MQRLVGCAARRSLAGFMSTSSLAKKRQKTSVMAASNTKTIGTHSGTFHCDEALGCFLLHQTKVRGCGGDGGVDGDRSDVGGCLAHGWGTSSSIPPQVFLVSRRRYMSRIISPHA